jgi:hypothetical protein
MGRYAGRMILVRMSFKRPSRAGDEVGVKCVMLAKYHGKQLLAISTTMKSLHRGKNIPFRWDVDVKLRSCWPTIILLTVASNAPLLVQTALSTDFLDMIVVEPVSLLFLLPMEMRRWWCLIDLTLRYKCMPIAPAPKRSLP